MKKLFQLSVTALLLMSLTACQSAQKATPVGIGMGSNEFVKSKCATCHMPAFYDSGRFLR